MITHPDAPTWHEATVRINGTDLTFAESMTLRVAVSSMQMSLSDPAMRKGLGEALAENYGAHLLRIWSLMTEHTTP